MLKKAMQGLQYCNAIPSDTMKTQSCSSLHRFFKELVQASGTAWGGPACCIHVMHQFSMTQSVTHGGAKDLHDEVQGIQR